MGLPATSITVDQTAYRYHYLCRYLPLASGTDPISRSLMKFKRRAQPDLDAWIDCTLTALAEAPPIRDTVIIRALGHRETAITEARTTALDLLCRAIARDFQCRYLPALLSKTRPTIGNKNLSRKDRELELRDVYSAASLPIATADAHSATPRPVATADAHSATPRPVATADAHSAAPRPAATADADPAAPRPAATADADPVAPRPAATAGPDAPTTAPMAAGGDIPFLLIDDILTTGATLRAIIGALCHQYPSSSIRVFTLARAAFDAGLDPIDPPHGRIFQLNGGIGWTPLIPAGPN